MTDTTATIKPGDIVRMEIDHTYTGEVLEIHRYRGEVFAKVRVTKDCAVTERIGCWEVVP